MPLTPLCAAHMNSIREALLSNHSPSKLRYQVSGFGYQVISQTASISYQSFQSFSPLLWWVLVTAELKSDLKVIGAEVVEVLHPAAH